MQTMWNLSEQQDVPLRRKEIPDEEIAASGEVTRLDTKCGMTRFVSIFSFENDSCSPYLFYWTVVLRVQHSEPRNLYVSANGNNIFWSSSDKRFLMFASLVWRDDSSRECAFAN